MSTLANDYYKYARLATAAYVDLTDVVDLRNRDQLSGAANGQRRMPTALGDQFFDVTNGWSILGDPRFPLAGGGEQHNDPASGFAATLFKDNVTGEKVLAIRGTEI